jgi:cytochrome b
MLTLKTLRLSHLLLALGATAAYLTGEAGGGIHKLIGYTVAALLILRLLLSLGGGVFALSRWIPRAKAPAGQGGLKHPAISRLLVLAILTCTAGAGTTGVLMDQGRALANPQFTLGEGDEGEEREGGEGRAQDNDDDEALRSTAPFARQLMVAGVTYRGDAEGEEEEEGPLGELHELFANLLLPLVGIHVAYLLLFRLPLAQFMLFWPKRKAKA